MKKKEKTMTYKIYEPEILKRLQDAQLEILEKFIAVCDKYDLAYIMIGGTAIGVMRHQGFIPWDDDIDVAMPRKDYNRFLEVYQQEMGDEYRILTPLVDKNYACNVTHLQKKGTRFVPYTAKDMKCELCIDIDIFPMDHMPDDSRLRSRQLKRTWVLNKLIFLCGTPHPIIPLTGIKKKISEVLCCLMHYALKICHVSPRFLYQCLVKECTRYNHQKTRYINAFEGPMACKAFFSKSDLFPLRDMKFENLTVKMPNRYDVYLGRLYGDYMQMPPEEERVNHCPYILDFGDGINVVEEENRG